MRGWCVGLTDLHCCFSWFSSPVCTPAFPRFPVTNNSIASHVQTCQPHAEDACVRACVRACEKESERATERGRDGE
eukprot:2993602-Rhodomonas_salina.1